MRVMHDISLSTRARDSRLLMLHAFRYLMSGRENFSARRVFRRECYIYSLIGAEVDRCRIRFHFAPARSLSLFKGFISLIMSFRKKKFTRPKRLYGRGEFMVDHFPDVADAARRSRED